MKDIKRKIRRIETIWLIVFGIIITITNLIAIFIIIVQATYNCKYKGTEKLEIKHDLEIWEFSVEINQYLKDYLLIWFKIVIVVFEIVLYFILRRLLITELHFYYTTNKTNLKILMVTSWLFFWFQILLWIYSQIDDFEPDEVSYLKTSCTYHMWFIIVYMIVDILSYFPLFFYTYYNIKNVDFKLYVKQSLKGMKMEDHYLTISVFIRNSCCIKNGLQKTTQETSSSSLNQDEYSDFFSEQTGDSQNSLLKDDYKKDYRLLTKQITGIDPE